MELDHKNQPRFEGGSIPGLLAVPEFRPTLEEMQDFAGYIEKLENEHTDYALVKGLSVFHASLSLASKSACVYCTARA